MDLEQKKELDGDELQKALKKRLGEVEEFASRAGSELIKRSFKVQIENIQHLLMLLEQGSQNLPTVREKARNIGIGAAAELEGRGLPERVIGQITEEQRARYTAFEYNHDAKGKPSWGEERK